MAHGTPFIMSTSAFSVAAAIASDQYPIGAQISYKCPPGFRFQGNYILTCSAGGCWTPMPPPVCKMNGNLYGKYCHCAVLSAQFLINIAIKADYV